MMKTVLPFLILGVLATKAASSAETVTVDFGRITGPATQRACGFLHSLTPDLPPDALVVPLNVRMSRMGPGSLAQKRGAFGCHDRVASLGAVHQIVVSDGHGYGRSGWPGDDGDWSRWENLVADMVRQASEAGYDFHWDIWNEPDIAQFWNPVPDDPAAQWDRFKETWTRGYRVIRGLDPDAVIVGPSNSGFDTNLFSVNDFLAFAHEQGVLPDLVSWHEWHPSRIVPHVEETEAFMEENGMPEIPISINEYVTHPHQTEPGILAWYLSALEEAKVHSAAHACWPEPDGVSNCRRPQLDGILTADGKEPRSTWWVYRTYAEITGELVKVEPGSTTHGLAGYTTETAEIRILLGRKGDAATSVEISLTGLAGIPDMVDASETVRVEVERILDSGWEALPKPVFVFGGRYRTDGGTLTLTLRSFGPTDAYSVTIRPVE
jgi:hypothetical protein